ncbi:uncharacterized protein LOC134177438 isoform X2 [Corticium candelabrum]|nr:uncharacterized protein LOC134177438 isoform X2 [Corticium candelabrum]
MTCFVRDYVLPKALVSWFAQDGSRYKNVSTGPRFVINSSQLNDTGLYYCRAINNPTMRSATKAFHITVYEPVRCTSLRQSVVTGPKLNMSVEIVLEGSPLPTKSNIIPVRQWYIKENRNNSFIVVTKTVDHPVEASGQEYILLTHQTVRSGINSRNISSNCTVNISNEILDKYRESRNFCVTLQANIQNCLFKQVAPEAAKYFATISAVVHAGIG